MTLEQRLAKLEGKFKALNEDIKKRKLSQRVAALEKRLPKPPHGKDKGKLVPKGKPG